MFIISANSFKQYFDIYIFIFTLQKLLYIWFVLVKTLPTPKQSCGKSCNKCYVWICVSHRDTAGQERFRTITTAYYRGAMVTKNTQCPPSSQLWGAKPEFLPEPHPTLLRMLMPSTPQVSYSENTDGEGRTKEVIGWRLWSIQPLFSCFLSFL